MLKIKRIFNIRKEIAGREGLQLLSITQKGIVPKDISRNEGQTAADYSKYQIVHVDDYAMNHMDLRTGWVDLSNYEGVTSPDYRVFILIMKCVSIRTIISMLCSTATLKNCFIARHKE